MLDVGLLDRARMAKEAGAEHSRCPENAYRPNLSSRRPPHRLRCGSCASLVSQPTLPRCSTNLAYNGERSTVPMKGVLMALTQTDVRGIADYARIALEGDELEQMTAYLNDAVDMLAPRARRSQ